MSFDINKPYRTRDGREAKAIQGPDGRFYGWHRTRDGEVSVESWESTGRFWGNQYADPDALDLVNVPEKRTVKVWLNVYVDPSEGRYIVEASIAGRGPSDVLAERNRSYAERLACLEREITFEVGEGL